MTGQPPQPLAIDGGAPVRTAPWPSDPPPPPAADPDPVAALEAELAAYLGLPPQAAVLCEGLDAALLLALRACEPPDAEHAESGDAGSGGEAVVPAHLGGPAARAALRAGLRPVPADVDAETAALSPRGLASAAGERTVAAVAVHAFGHPAPMTELARLVAHRDIALVEEASAALGAAEHGRTVGTIGHAAVFGFAESALLAAPGGAAAVSADPARAARLRALRDEAAAPIDEAHARAALGALRRAPAFLDARRQHAWEISLALRRRRALAGMAHGRRVRHAYNRYVVRLRPLLWKRPLDETVAALRAEGIPCEPALGPPLYLDDAVRRALRNEGGEDDPRLDPSHFPVAERLPREMIAVPLAASMTQRDIDDLAAALDRVERAST